jgi:hypothetical protein
MRFFGGGGGAAAVVQLVGIGYFQNLFFIASFII